jgi:hypothetical protein
VKIALAFSTRLALLVALLCQLGCATESFESRVKRLSNGDENFAAASRILGKQGTNTSGEIKQAIHHLNAALEHQTSAPDKSVIQTTLAQIHLINLRDCREAKRYSSAAVASDPKSDHALEVDVSSDFCFAGISGDYGPVIGRMENLSKQGREFRLLYSLMGNAYMIRSDQTNARADMLKAKDAFMKAKQRGEPEASPDALARSIEELARRLRTR